MHIPQQLPLELGAAGTAPETLLPVVLTVDDNDSPRDVIDALALTAFVVGRQRFATSTSLTNVRDDATLLPTGVQVTRESHASNERARLALGDGWTLRVVHFPRTKQRHRHGDRGQRRARRRDPGQGHRRGHRDAAAGRRGRHDGLLVRRPRRPATQPAPDHGRHLGRHPRQLRAQRGEPVRSARRGRPRLGAGPAPAAARAARHRQDHGAARARPRVARLVPGRLRARPRAALRRARPT